MIIVPIGHDKLIRRLPYLTIAIIGFTVIIWFIAYPLQLKQQNQVHTVYEEEVAEKEMYLMNEYIKEHTEELNDPYFREKFYKSLKNGEIVAIESKEYKEWEVAHEKFIKMQKNTVFYRFGYKPRFFSIFTLVSSMFLHGGFFHLIFNMLFLWLVGLNIEDHWGRPLFLSLFLIGGIVATLFYTLFTMGSTIPLIGASGAISALMGAFAVRFHNTKIRFFYFFLIFFRPFWGTFLLYAWFALGFWFAEQLFYAIIMKGIFTGVAFFAHIGGFLFGLAAGFGIKVFKIEEKFLFSKIEKQIEAVELSPKLSIAFSKKDSGDVEGAVKLLKEVIAENPTNNDARLELARCLLLLEREKQAARHYETILSGLYEKGKTEELFNVFLEVYEKKLEQFFSAKTLFRTGSYLVSIEEYKKGVELFSMIVKHYPTDRLAPTSLLKMGRIFLNNLKDEPLGKGALEFLVKNYPDYSGTHEAQTILMKYNN